jgi:hypothetical protein
VGSSQGATEIVAHNKRSKLGLFVKGHIKLKAYNLIKKYYTNILTGIYKLLFLDDSKSRLIRLHLLGFEHFLYYVKLISG